MNGLTIRFQRNRQCGKVGAECFLGDLKGHEPAQYDTKELEHLGDFLPWRKTENKDLKVHT
jgi:hypothetical protein